MSFSHTEKRLREVAPVSFTANGTALGVATLTTTCDFKVKQRVTISATGEQSLVYEVKRVISLTELIVGPVKTPIQTYSDISQFTLAKAPSISAQEQIRPNIPEQEIERLTYEEEPTIARRSVLVDKVGQKIDMENPLPVQLSNGSIEIGTVNAELEVQLSHQDNVPDAGDVADSVQVGDGTEILAINPDGSINVNVSLNPSSGVYLNIFDTASSVASAASAVITTYTVPVGKTAFLTRVEYSGSNMAIYEVDINATIEAKKRTYFGGDFAGAFEFSSSGGSGFPLVAGDVIKLSVTNIRPSVGDFEGRIQIIEI